MKTKMIAFVAVLLFAAVSFSQASSIKEREVKNLHAYLSNTVKFPCCAMDKGIEGTATFVVKVDENQKLQVSNIQGTCCEFKDYIEEWFQKLEDKPIKFSEKIGTKKVVIHFKLI